MKTYAVHSIGWKVKDIMTTDVPLSDLVHPGLAFLFVEIPDGVEVYVGDMYDPETQTWTHPEPPEDPDASDEPEEPEEQ